MINKKILINITALLIIIVFIISPFNNLAGAQVAPPTPTPPPTPTYEGDIPTPPPAPIYEEEIPTPPSAFSSQQQESGDNSSGNVASNDNDTQYSGVEAINSGNGSGSVNDSNVDVENDTSIDIDNNAEVSNAIKIEAVTGENQSSRNTGGANIIETGNANVTGVISTDLNNTQVSGVSCNLCGSQVTAVNKDNGASSDNLGTANVDNNTEVDIYNDADIETEILALSLTGQNDASRNVGDSAIITGNANLTTTVITDANTTAFGIYNFDIVGNQTGDITLDANPVSCVNCGNGGNNIAQNSGNGTDSQNQAATSSSNSFTETITNDGDIVNNINLEAISGGNSADRNTAGDSSITTGDANVVANVINTLNTSISGGLIYSVNIFGDLIGDIILPSVDADNSLACSNCCGQDTTAANIGNGADSQNLAEANSETNTTIDQSNNASINNNLNLAGNTGSNETNSNTNGTSLIDAGEVNISANTANIANINVATSSCSDEPIYIVMVNQIGDWLGQVLGLPSGSFVYGSNGQIYQVGNDGKLVALNLGNGSGSQNSASVNSETNTTIAQNNTGSITNNINILADTGNNSASRNTGGASSITTGDSNIMVNVVNFINSNFAGRKVVLTLVNVFGQFLGNVLGPNHIASADDNSQDNQSNDQTSDDSANNDENDQDGQEENEYEGQIIASSTQIKKGSKLTGSVSGSDQISEDLPTAGNADDIITGSSKINWLWLLLLLPAGAVIYLFRKRFVYLFSKK